MVMWEGVLLFVYSILINSVNPKLLENNSVLVGNSEI